MLEMHRASYSHSHALTTMGWIIVVGGVMILLMLVALGQALDKKGRLKMDETQKAYLIGLLSALGMIVGMLLAAWRLG